MLFGFFILSIMKLRQSCFNLEIVLHTFWNKIQGNSSVNVQMYLIWWFLRFNCIA